jgi:hypothetical protein
MDIVEANKNLKLLHADKDKIESLNHLNSTQAFKFECDKRVRQIDRNIEVLKENIKRHARQ